jgi:hypothetical protein
MKRDSPITVEQEVKRVLNEVNAPMEIKAMTKKIAYRIWNDGRVTVNMPNGKRVKMTYLDNIGEIKAEVA